MVFGKLREPQKGKDVMKTVALMPMKGVSERVPNKNMRLFNGNPLCSYMLDLLCSSKSIDLVVVNTDSEEIEAFLRSEYPKVRVLKRPDSLLGHDISMNKIIEYDLSMVRGDIIIQTHSTNPLLRRATLESAIQKFRALESSYDSLFSVTRYQTRFFSDSGEPINHNPEVLIKTQDLPFVYEENSCFYLFTPGSFKKNNRRIGEKPFMMAVDHIEAVDIDVEAEFTLAEKLHKIL